MRYIRLSALFALVLTTACGERWVMHSLSGHYNLIHPELCWNDVESSKLVLREDGTFDQYVRLKDGSDLAIQSERWSYDRASKRITFSKFLKSYENTFPIEPRPPAIVSIDNSGKCYYTQQK